MITPSGRFVPNTDICTTFTSMHPEEWNPAWTVESILTGFLSFMTSDEYGSGSIHPRSSEGRESRKIELAKESKRWNSLQCPRFREDFPHLHAANLKSETFTAGELERYGGTLNEVSDNATVAREALLDTSYESHINEDWEKFGSMEEDWDYYDDDDDDDDKEEDEEEDEMHKDYESLETEFDWTS